MAYTRITIREIENVLDIYSIEDILDLNDVTIEDTVFFLVDSNFIRLPKPEPIQ